MANVKSTILKKKIDNVVYDLMVKTVATMVYVDDTTTLASKLTAIDGEITGILTNIETMLGADTAAYNIATAIATAVNTAKEAMNDASDPTSLAGKLKAIGEKLASIEDEETGILATAKAYTDEKIALPAEYTTVKAYVEAVETELNAKIAGGFHFKGTKDYVKDLPTSGMATGDVWQVKYTGESGEARLDAEYAYNGSAWVELGSFVDLSPYSTTVEVNGFIETAANDVNDYTDEEIEKVETTLATKARFLVSSEQPTDLTASDIWAQIVG